MTVEFLASSKLFTGLMNANKSRPSWDCNPEEEGICRRFELVIGTTLTIPSPERKQKSERKKSPCCQSCGKLLS
jgi:hypothetical protein